MATVKCYIHTSVNTERTQSVAIFLKQFLFWRVANCEYGFANPVCDLRRHAPGLGAEDSCGQDAMQRQAGQEDSCGQDATPA